MPPIRRLALLVLLLPALAGCANLLAERESRLRRLVGQPLAALIAAEGVPDRSFDHGGVTYLAYLRRRVDFIPPPPMIGPPWSPGGFPGPLGWYPEPPPRAVMRSCQTVFAVKRNIVTGFTLSGNDCG